MHLTRKCINFAAKCIRNQLEFKTVPFYHSVAVRRHLTGRILIIKIDIRAARFPRRLIVRPRLIIRRILNKILLKLIRDAKVLIGLIDRLVCCNILEFSWDRRRLNFE